MTWVTVPVPAVTICSLILCQCLPLLPSSSSLFAMVFCCPSYSSAVPTPLVIKPPPPASCRQYLSSPSHAGHFDLMLQIEGWLYQALQHQKIRLFANIVNTSRRSMSCLLLLLGRLYEFFSAGWSSARILVGSAGWCLIVSTLFDFSWLSSLAKSDDMKSHKMTHLAGQSGSINFLFGVMFVVNCSLMDMVCFTNK